MNTNRHNLIVIEIIEHLNKCFAEHDFDQAECMVTLESIVASALVSTAPRHEDCCTITHAFFKNVHARVHAIIETEVKPKNETRKDLN